MVLISLALGVVIFVSSYESVVAAQDSIASSAKAMSTKVDWEVSRGRYLGVEESLVEKIRNIPGAIAAPIVETTTSTVGSHPSNFLVVGLDLDSLDTVNLIGQTSEADLSAFLQLSVVRAGIIVSDGFALKSGISKGSVLTLQSVNGNRSVPVIHVLASKLLETQAGGNVGFMAIHEAENQFGKPGIADKILVAGVSRDKIEQICPTCQIQRPGKLGSAAEDALGRIKSLLGVSVIALLVGILLIYNSVQVSVLERLQDIAVLRAIGATRIQIFVLLLSEWLVIGFVGSSLGIVVGSGLAFALVEYTKKTVNTMIPLVADAHVHVGPTLIVISLVIGMGTAVAAAFFPVWIAANVRPLEILRPYSYRRVRQYLPAALIGAGLFILANIVVATQSVTFSLGIAVTGIEFFGIALLFPQIVLTTGNKLRLLLRQLKNPAPFLAIDSLMKAPHRTAFTMMTFGCALMMIVATKTLVDGFKASTGSWMSAAFPFDISVMGNDLATSVYGSQVLPTTLTEKLRNVPGVMSAYSVRKLFTPYAGQDVMAIGIDMDRYLSARKEKSMGLWPPELSQPEVLTAFRSGTGAFLSSNFAKLYSVNSGDNLKLNAPSGRVNFKVLGVVDDYSWQHGAIIVNLETLEQKWKDSAVSYIDISVAKGSSIQDVKDRVQSVATQDRSAFAYDKAEIREVTDSVLEQAVAMANLQAIIGVLIGVLGIVNSIWIGVMNRKREIAVWRAIGVTKSQVGVIVLCEGLFIAAISALVGTLGGLYGGWVPLRAFSFEVTGYLYPPIVPWGYLLFVAFLAFALGILAGLFPSRQAANLPILDSIGYE